MNNAIAMTAGLSIGAFVLAFMLGSVPVLLAGIFLFVVSLLL